MEKDRDSKVIDLWLQCYTQEEIAQRLDVTKGWINQFLNGYDKDGKHYDGYIEKFRNGKIAESKLLAEFTPQLYNIWNFARNNNETEHIEDGLRTSVSSWRRIEIAK